MRLLVVVRARLRGTKPKNAEALLRKLIGVTNALSKAEE